MSEDRHSCLHTMQPSVSQSKIKFHSPIERSSIIKLRIRNRSFVDKAAIQHAKDVNAAPLLHSKKNMGFHILLIPKYIPLIIINVCKYFDDSVKSDNDFHTFGLSN